MPYLSALLERWRQADANEQEVAREEAHTLALAIHEYWPVEAVHSWRASQQAQAGELLAALAELGDPAAAAKFIAERIAAGAYGAGDNAPLVAVLAELPEAQAAELLNAVISGNGPVKPTACADLLARYTAQSERSTEPLCPAAEGLLAALPGAADRAANTAAEPRPEQRYRREPPSPALVADTLTALSRIDAALAERALTLFLENPERYPIDGILLPAALHLVEQDRPGASKPHSDAAKADPACNGAAATRLRETVLQHLEQRIAEPLAPPDDWQRPATIRCTCTDCRNLNSFLASATASTWRLKAAEQARKHVEHSIQRSQCDLNRTTDKRGRPYTLVCTKNQASHERRVQQREKDLANRQRLRAALS